MRRYIGGKNTLYKNINSRKNILFSRITSIHTNSDVVHTDIMNIINALNEEDKCEMERLIGELKNDPRDSSKLESFIEAMEKVIVYTNTITELNNRLKELENMCIPSGIIQVEQYVPVEFDILNVMYVLEYGYPENDDYDSQRIDEIKNKLLSK